MYPGQIVRWHDRSQIVDTTPAEVNYAPLFMTVISSDMGPEDFREVSGRDFFRLYGTPTIDKHGQIGVQAANICNAGGRLFVKRIVAEDSLRANAIVVANISIGEKQAKDSFGNLLYLDADGNITTEVTENPLMVKCATNKLEVKTIENCKSFEDVASRALALENKSAGIFPLIIVAESGRGTSIKSFRLSPDYNISRTMGNMFYQATIYSQNKVLENGTVTLDTDVIYNNAPYRLDESRFGSLVTYVDPGVYQDMITYIAEGTGVSEREVRNSDILNGVTSRGKELSFIEIDPDSIDVNANYGIELKSGSNGNFGDNPGNPLSAGYVNWVAEMVKAYDGTVTDEIYDLDQHKISAIIDGNLPMAVKTAIAKLVAFRKDCVFFRDLGTGLKTLKAILEKFDEVYTDADILPETVLDDSGEVRDDNRFIATYHTSYMIKDPTTYRNVEVTMMYDLAPLLVAHFSDHYAAPLAGIANGFVLPSAIKGTINFTPTITPSYNQKDTLDEARINYAIFDSDDCVVQSSYTSQKALSQMSFINNVILIQTVMRTVRATCPIVRYTLSTTSDLQDYSDEVTNVLSNFSDLFSVLRFTYTGNEVSMLQKIYYASIEFGFLGWAQTEIFDVYSVLQ